MDDSVKRRIALTLYKPPVHTGCLILNRAKVNGSERLKDGPDAIILRNEDWKFLHDRRSQE